MNKFLNKKAYEISYALYRLADVARRRSHDMANRLENYGVEIISLTSSAKPDDVSRHMYGLEYLLRLCRDTGALHHHNVEIILGEIAKFKNTLSQTQQSLERTPRVELAHFSAWDDVGGKKHAPPTDTPGSSSSHSARPVANSSSATGEGAKRSEVASSATHRRGGNPVDVESSQNRPDPITAFEEEQHRQHPHRPDRSKKTPQISPRHSEEAKQSGATEESRHNLTHHSDLERAKRAEREEFRRLQQQQHKPEIGADNKEKSGNNAETHNLTDRHETILGRIAENGNCRTKEITELFPDLSPRTIRYDLQKLLDEGLIERKGNGGPSTYYVLAREMQLSSQ